MNIAGLERSLKSGSLKPVYLIYGPEDFLRREALLLIREAAAAGPHETDISEPEADGLEPAVLLDDLRTASLFAPRRLIIVDGAGALIAQSGDLFAAYAARAEATATLVLLAESLVVGKKNTKAALAESPDGRKKNAKAPAAESPDGRKKRVKALLAKAVSVECPALNPRAVPSWCIKRARRHGKPMPPATAKLLVDLAGSDLGQLDGHIQALASYCSEREKITDDDVTDLIGGDHARTVWELVRAVTNRSPAAALRALDRLLRQPKVTTVWILAALARETRDLWQVKHLADRDCPAADIQARLGKPPWLIQRIMKTVGGIPEPRLRANHRKLLEADLDSKTGAASDEWILQTLVMGLCGQ